MRWRVCMFEFLEMDNNWQQPFPSRSELLRKREPDHVLRKRGNKAAVRVTTLRCATRTVCLCSEFWLLNGCFLRY